MAPSCALACHAQNPSQSLSVTCEVRLVAHLVHVHAGHEAVQAFHALAHRQQRGMLHMLAGRLLTLSVGTMGAGPPACAPRASEGGGNSGTGSLLRVARMPCVAAAARLRRLCLSRCYLQDLGGLQNCSVLAELHLQNVAFHRCVRMERQGIVHG